MNVWLVNPFDPLPDESFRAGRYAYLADMLSMQGHKVTWWTSNFFHLTKEYRYKEQTEIVINQNYRIIALKTPRYRRNIGLSRILNHYAYARNLFKEAKTQERPDIILASTPPIGAPFVASILARKFGAALVVDIQDFWPDGLQIALPKILRPVGGILLYPLELVMSRVYNRADAILAVSKTYLEKALELCGNDKRWHVLYIGIDLDLFNACSHGIDPENYRKGEDEFWCTYIGNIGRNYDVGTILRTASLLQSSHPKIKFLIAGDGPYLDSCRRTRLKMGLENVILTGLLPYGEMAALLKQSDVGLNTLAKDTWISFPNKVFEYMAAGLPIINSTRREFQELVQNEAIGLQYCAGDEQSLKEAVCFLYENRAEAEQMGRKARNLVEERFDRKISYPRAHSFILGSGQ